MIHVYIFLLIVVLAFVMVVLSLRNRSKAGARYLLYLSLTVLLWAGVYLFASIYPRLVNEKVLAAILLMVASFASIILLMFGIVYGNRAGERGPLVAFLLVFEPILTQVLFWPPFLHRLFFNEQNIHSIYIFRSGGLWSDIHIMFLLGLEIVAILLFVDVLFKRPKSWMKGSYIVLAGICVPLFIRFSEIVNLYGSAQKFDYTLVGYAIALTSLAYGAFVGNWMEVMPITRDAVVGGMNDGWMVLDLQNRIIDFNPAVEKILGIAYKSVYGKPIRTVLPDWPEVSSPSEGIRELEIRRSMRSQDEWRYLNVRISTLKDQKERPFGQLIVWRDITERKLVEDARQRARDEMFIILNAISNAASRSMSLDDFLSESIYQMIYPFQSQVVAVFLVDEAAKAEGQDVLRIASHFGLTIPPSKSSRDLLIPSSTFDFVVNGSQPFVIGNASVDQRVPKILREAEIRSLVALPMVAQTEDTAKILGVLVLGRKEGDTYSQDEVIRLTAIAEQITNLIDSDRRRQLAIAFSERERLMRDLHDSVSQKLYGLVTLTEAAQAGLEAGSKVSLADVMVKIGDGARQAVKEMRLFLFEMQPMDLEKEGLVTVLHHRLAAVEGRADIQARMIADDDIEISKNKEVALYYIAQEALNNVLKHARAKSVSVTIKQTRQNVVLEVMDDGHGFEPKKVDRGGMGLQNMKARAAQIDGKLKIQSKPGAGAKITLTVARDKIHAIGRSHKAR